MNFKKSMSIYVGKLHEEVTSHTAEKKNQYEKEMILDKRHCYS